MDFLTPGQKIRKLRKQFGLRQQDISDKHMTRNFISMVEQNKRGLGQESARRLTENFNRVAKEQGIELNINQNYFLMSIEEQLKEYCSDILHNFKSISDVNEVIQIAKENSLKKILAEGYMIRGNIEYDNNNYECSFIDYSKAADIFMGMQYIAYQGYLYNRLGKCKLKESDYVEALLYFDKSKRVLLINNDDNLFLDSNYNVALCYKELGKYQQAINMINDYTDNDLQQFKEYIYGNILKAKCYIDKKDYNTAVNIYFNLINKIKIEKKNNHLDLIYNCLGEVYLLQKDVYKALNYLEKAEKLDIDGNLLDTILLNKGRIYIEQKKYSNASITIKMGIEKAKKNNNVENIIKGYYLLVDIYEYLYDFLNYEKVYIKIIKLLSGLKNREEEILKVKIKLALLNLKLERYEKVKNYLNNSFKY